MAAEIPREIELELGVQVEKFNTLPKPYVHFHGAAANGEGRPLANLVQLKASKYRYLAVVELPRIQFCENEVEWAVNHDSEVTIEGQISTAAIFADKPRTCNRRNRVQLCPTEPWAISFYLPGPVEWWTTSVFSASDNLLEIVVFKEITEAEISAFGSRALVPTETSGLGSRALIPETETIPADLTGFMTVVDTSFAGVVRYVPLPETSTTNSTAFVPAGETLTSGSTTVLQETENSASDSTAFVLAGETSASGSTAFVPEAETSASSSTAFVSARDSGRSSQEPEGDTLLTPSEIAYMVDGWFK